MAIQALEIGGVKLSLATLNEVTALICEKGGAAGASFHFWNAYNLALVHSSPEYAFPGSASQLIFPDGMPLVWLARQLDKSKLTIDRIYGPDVMLNVLATCNSKDSSARHFFLGGSDASMSRLIGEVERLFPHLTICGFYSPPYGEQLPDEIDHQLRLVSESTASHIWVGLGTPKQDFVARTLAGRYPGKFLAVGAAFDFIAGTKRQAPIWMRKTGLEWLFRLTQEPKRLFKRYLFGNLIFIAIALRALLSRGT